MYEAYESLTILERFPLQIETITAYDGNLVVGTKQGHLLMYSITSDSLTRMKINLLRSNKNFSRKPITQIAVVPEHQILISLSDSLISVHDLTVFNFPLLSTLPKTQGSTTFDLDVKHYYTGVDIVSVRLVTAVRKRLQLYKWKARQFQQLTEEIMLQDTPKSLAWCGEGIIIGFKHDYWLIKLTGEQIELFSTGRSQQPLITKISDECVAVGRDERTLFVNDKGRENGNPSLKWEEQPLIMVHDEPYMIAVLPKGIEIQLCDPQLSVQTLELDKAKFLASAIISKNKRQIFAASVTHIWSLCRVPISKQIPQLLGKKQFELALKLADLWDESSQIRENMKQHIKKLHAFHLFCEHKFEAARKLFFDLDADLLFVIGLYPDLVPEEYRARVTYPEPVPPLPEDKLTEALEELVHFLLQMRRRLLQLGSDVDSSSKKQIIDTTLLKCYLKTNDSLITPLLRMPDSRVSVEEGDKVLRQAQKYSELLLLFQIRKLHSRALELLLRHSKRKGSPLYGHLETVKYLQCLEPEYIDLIFEYGRWVLKAYPEDGLRIFTGGDHYSEVERLPRPRVLGFLKKTEKSLVIPYLEHVIWEWGDLSHLMHNELVYHYRLSSLASSPEEEQDIDQFKQRKEESRAKLLKFLKLSESYTAATILVHFAHDDLYEERAILLGRLGQHHEALKLYVDVLNDVEGALEYCHRLYSSVGHSSEVYLILIKLLLGNTREVDEESQGAATECQQTSKDHRSMVVDILKNYSQRIDVAQALKTLPDSMNVQVLKSFILQSMIRLSTVKKDNQLVRGLTQAIRDQTKFDLNSSQMQKIYLSDKNVCGVCRKKFAKSSAFVWHFSGEIFHFLCKEQRSPRL